MEIQRTILPGGIVCDYDALPCPRCRSTNIKKESHPSFGSMASCLDCGAKSYFDWWNDGKIHMEKIPGKPYYKGIEMQEFTRPDTDVIKFVEWKEIQRARNANDNQPIRGWV